MDIAHIIQKLANQSKRLDYLESLDTSIAVGAILKTSVLQPIPAEIFTKINFNIIEDPYEVIINSGVQFTKHRWVTISISMESSEILWKNRDIWEVLVLKNGLEDATLGMMIFGGNITTPAFASGSTTITANAGDIIEIAVYSSDVVTLSGNIRQCHASIIGVA